MNGELSSQGLAELSEALQVWLERWNISVDHLDAFLQEADVVTRFNALVGDQRSFMTTDIPQRARRELSELIADVVRPDARRAAP